MKIVLDTNILLVCISKHSELRWIFDRFLDESYTLCVTTEIMAEYEEILERFMGHDLASTILQIIENAPNVELVTTYYAWNLIHEDPDDNKFVDCAIACNAKYLVSHDRHYKVLKTISFPIVEVISAVHFKTILER